MESRETKLVVGMFILDTSLAAPRWDQVTLQVTLRRGACSGDVRDDQHYGGSRVPSLFPGLSWVIRVFHCGIAEGSKMPKVPLAGDDTGRVR